MTRNRPKGIVLVQVLMISLILSLLAIAIIRWQLAGRLQVHAIEKHEQSRSRAEGCLAEFMAVQVSTAPLPSTYTCANGASIAISGDTPPYTLTINGGS